MESFGESFGKIAGWRIWEGFIPGLKQFDLYKYAITGANGNVVLKADPYGFHHETAPGTASKLYDIAGYRWHDTVWMKHRKEQNSFAEPMNIYEMHLGSWRRYRMEIVFL